MTPPPTREMPERIWAEGDAGPGRDTWWRTHGRYGGTEYIRADLPPPPEAKALCDEPSRGQEPAVFGLAASWRRGMRHAIERIDLVIEQKLAPRAKLAAIHKALAEVYALSEKHTPGSYDEAFKICSADLAKATGKPHGKAVEPSS